MRYPITYLFKRAITIAFTFTFPFTRPIRITIAIKFYHLKVPRFACHNKFPVIEKKGRRI